MKKSLLLASLILTPALAFAASAHQVAFLTNLYYWCSGGWGVGLAVTMMLLGAFLGVAHCGPGVTLAGVAGAGAIHWGPVILMHIMGVPVPEDAPENTHPVAAQVAPATSPATVKASDSYVRPHTSSPTAQ